MKVVYVTPRYGVEVLGGAEYAARMLAERLVSQLGWTVEVFTSRAQSSASWEPAYQAGTSDINGVQVRRFDGLARHDDFARTSDDVRRAPHAATPELQARWLDQQGPLVPELPDALAQSDADLFVFYPYLFHPIVRGLPRVANRSVLHPAAHDEWMLRIPLYRELFSSAAGLVFQTDGERRLTERNFAVAHKPQLLLGLGVDPQDGDERGFRDSSGIGDRPFVLCLGRVDHGKGSAIAERYFAEYKRRHPGPLALAFVGTVVNQPVAHEDVFVTGPVSDEHKWGALRGSSVLLSASGFEAFSLALVEGWAADQPALVNGACLATREHVERSGGGLWFDSYASFEASLELLLDPSRGPKLAAAGRKYVDERFRWPALIDRYGQFLEEIAERNRAQGVPAGAATS